MFFCFFKQKTADEMRISDWSSDVCSSDLHPVVRAETHDLARHEIVRRHAGRTRVEERRPLARSKVEQQEFTRRGTVRGADQRPFRSEERRVGKRVLVSGKFGWLRLNTHNMTVNTIDCIYIL